MKQDIDSLRSSVLILTPEQKARIVQKLDPQTALILSYDWELWARDKQRLPECSFTYWAIISGRGFGKTRTGVETVRIWKDNNPIMLLAGATAGDLRDIMIEGESGILPMSPPWDKPVYESSKSRLTWRNGAIAFLRSADEPDRFRGLQFYKAWLDELAAWRYPQETLFQIQMGLRLGINPQILITTTPRNIKVLKDIIADKNTVVTKGTTYENRANLSGAFFDAVIQKYEGTRLGRQEINAEILEDVEGALWTLKLIDENRVQACPDLVRAAVAIDPAVTSNQDSDETGIIRGGMDENGEIYIQEDRSGIYTPNGWAAQAINQYELHKLDKVVAETNNGGDMIEGILRNINPHVSFQSVWASRGKITRAEPIVALYEQNRVHHVGSLPKLEDEMCNWVLGDKSPNRVDALVWLITYLVDGVKNTDFYVV